MAVVLAVTVGAGYVGSAVIARHRAQAAADLAALAAATLLPSGLQTACREASTLASKMATAMTSCNTENLDVIVSVEAPVGFAPSGVSAARAIARAGPGDR